MQAHNGALRGAVDHDFPGQKSHQREAVSTKLFTDVNAPGAFIGHCHPDMIVEAVRLELHWSWLAGSVGIGVLHDVGDRLVDHEDEVADDGGGNIEDRPGMKPAAHVDGVLLSGWCDQVKCWSHLPVGMDGRLQLSAVLWSRSRVSIASGPSRAAPFLHGDIHTRDGGRLNVPEGPNVEAGSSGFLGLFLQPDIPLRSQGPHRRGYAAVTDR